ncbi:Phage regulatory protein Rha [compost metagenome]
MSDFDVTEFEKELGLSVNTEGKIVTNSIKVAEKYKKEHRNVMARIRDFIALIPELGVLNFKQSFYLNEQNKKQPMYIMDRQGFSMLVNKFTGDEATIFTYQYTKAFEQLEQKLSDTQEYISEITNKIKKENVLTLDELNDIRFSVGRTIKTFGNASIKEIDSLVQDFILYIGKLETKARLARCKSAIDGIERLHDQLASQGVHNIGNCYNLKQYVIDIQTHRHKLENKRNGGHKAALTKKVNELVTKVKEFDDTYISDGVSGIYCICNVIDGRKYIGSSKDIKKRLSRHVNDLENNTHHNSRLQEAWNTYGQNCFRFSVLEECEPEELEVREYDWIAVENATDEEYGYNIYNRTLLCH